MPKERAIPYRVANVRPIAEVRAGRENLDSDVRTGSVETVGGRILLLRRQGGVIFATLGDSSGQIQLLISRQQTEEFVEIGRDRVLGDWVSATGEVITSRRGELSIAVTDMVLLANARRSFGDKWHGVTDPDTRYRQRYVDLWANPPVRDRFLKRSKMIYSIRQELHARGFIEVETPLLHSLVSGASARPFTTHHNALDLDLYLRIAPELYLKRLVVGGFERVFEIGRNFRNEGISPRHNPEFTMLELYQAYADYRDIMELTESLVAGAAVALTGSTIVSLGGRVLDLTPPFRRASMEELVSQAVDVEVRMSDSLESLRQLADANGCHYEESWETGKILAALYEDLVEATLFDPVFVTDYPKVISPLARDHRDPIQTNAVERFELVVAGRELANAFSELIDPDEQRRRFQGQLVSKAQGDEEAMDLDEDYLRALEYGLPPTGGLGIGIDRLAMFLTDTEQIREVILFPTMRPEAAPLRDES
ncbi:MAG: lysine--tRNA ligase [Ferrimicrobium sp.]